MLIVYLLSSVLSQYCGEIPRVAVTDIGAQTECLGVCSLTGC
jgi:hypothetical protein